VGLLKNKLLIILGVVLLLGGCAWLFIWFSRSKAPVSPAVNAIPVNAFCVIESQQARATWKKLAQGNLLWEDLGATQTAADISRTARLLDSLLAASPEAAALLENNPAWLSLHCTGNDELDWVFALSLPRLSDEDEAASFIAKASGKKFQEEAHTEASIMRGDKFSYALRQGTLILSDNNALVKASLDQLAKGHSLMKDKGFAAVLGTAGPKADGNIYLNYEQLPVFVKRITNENFHTHVERMRHFAGWTEVDLSLKPNAAMFNGFSTASDSARDFLSLFRKQKPQRMDMVSVLPASTATMIFYGVGDFPTYYQSHETYLEKHGMGAERSSSIMGISTQYRVDIVELMTSWIGNEMAMVTTAGPGSVEERSYAVLGSNNIALAREQLSKLKYVTDFIDRQAASHSEMVPDTSFFNGYAIRRLGILHLLPILFGSPFDRLDNTYYTIVGRYVVFANSDAALRSFIISYENGKTLANDRFYADFASNLSDASNVYIYSAVGRSKELYREYASTGLAGHLENQGELLSKIEAVGIQYSANNGLFYTNAFVRHSNTEEKQEISSLWETALDTVFSGRPQLLLNHNTKALDIFVQDDANTIYLISNTGKLAWKRRLPEKIIGDVQQVDALKNGKLQIAFCAGSSIYVIDRNGKDLAPFPLKLPAPSTNGLRVFDYDNNRDYRFLTACSDKMVYNYTIRGQKVEGWKFEAMQEIALAPIQHCAVAGKDYIVIADKSGRLYAVDRQGRARLQLKQRLCTPLYQFTLEPGKDLSKTRAVCADSSGNVLRVSFDDTPENIHLTELRTTPGFEYQDLDGDGVREFILLDTARLSVYTQDRKPLFNHILEKCADGKPLVFRLRNNEMHIGIVCRKASEIHLINSSGVALPGFPLFGDTPFSIGDLNNDGNYVMICGGKGSYLYAYPVK